MNIGSVSSGTMRPEDLIPAFVWELEHQKGLKPEHKALCDDINARMEDEGYYESDDDNASEDLSDLFAALDEYAPPYFYFGAHPGDGADYGYWLDESFQEDFDGLKVSDTAEVPEDYSGEVLCVNDHGNMTLYSAESGKLVEIWAIV